MDILSIFLIALALSMDAFACSLSCGIKIGQFKVFVFFKVAFFFGFFQFLMPLFGYYLGTFIKDYVEAFDHYLAFAIFFFLAVKTLYEVLKKQKKEGTSSCNCKKHFCLLLLALATSIDAFLVGLIFAVYSLSLMKSCLLIGITTFIISLMGLFLGKTARGFAGRNALILACLILFFMSIKALYI